MSLPSILCSLFAFTSNYIILFSERYSLSLRFFKLSVHCKSAFPVSRGASALPYIYLLVCKCPLHISKRHCDVIKHTHTHKKLSQQWTVLPVPAPLERLVPQWWKQTHLSALPILNCANFIIPMPDTTPCKNKNNNSKIQFDKAIIRFTNIWGEMWSQIICLMKSRNIGLMQIVNHGKVFNKSPGTLAGS